MNPGPTALLDMPSGSVACFQLADLGTDEVEDLDLEVEPVLVDPEPDLMDEAVDDDDDLTDRIEGAPFEVGSSSSVGLLGMSISMLWSAGAMIVALAQFMVRDAVVLVLRTMWLEGDQETCFPVSSRSTCRRSSDQVARHQH
jgi:hypothetical protein